MPEQRDPQRFDCLGLDLNRPVDSVKPQKFPFLQNVRAYQYGIIQQREGLTDINSVVAANTPTHSVRRLNDPLNSTFTRVVGTGTVLATGQTAFTQRDSGYSGDPLAMVPFHPDGSVTSWMYVADRSRQRKVDAAGTVHPIGLPLPHGVGLPIAAPAVALTTVPKYKVINEGEAVGAWANAGTAGAVALLAVSPGKVNTTVAQIIYDTGSTGWATVSPTSSANIGPGSRLVFDPGGGDEETVTVEEVHPVGTAGTIGDAPGGILYDVGSSGAASLILTTKIEQAQLNALVHNTTIGELARITAVITGPDGTTSMRLSTPSTWAATNAIQVLASFRVYLANTHAAAEQIQKDALTTSVTVGTGTVSLAGAIDLSELTTGVSVRRDDYIHISLRVDNPQLVTEGKILLDVDLATNDFTQNYYWRSFRANDLTLAAQGSQSLISNRSTAVQRRIIDESAIEGELGAVEDELVELETELGETVDLGLSREEYMAGPEGQQLTELRAIRAHLRSEIEAAGAQAFTPDQSQQMGLGDSQWIEFRFRVGDFTRVGTDESRSLENVAKIGITLITTGTVQLDFDAWWAGGGYGPDIGLDDPTRVPYLYRYRARIPATGVASNWSPATRGGETARRQSITVSPPQYPIPAGTNNLALTDFVLDIQRFGGSILTWHYVASIDNGATPSFDDEFLDSTAAKLPSSGQDRWQPWPVIGQPVSGTTTAVAGTTIVDKVTSFDTAWSPGTQIQLNASGSDQSTVFTIYRVISTSRLEVFENAGNLGADLIWRIDQPVSVAQPLPCLWGDEQLGAVFACGDSVNPGRLYYSNTHNPDATKDINYLDVTSPSEPLMNGVVFNLRSYVLSSDRMFQIMPTGDAAIPWTAQEIPGGRGLFSRWAMIRTPAPLMAFLTRDGIYGSTGGEAVPITDADLYTLFPSEGTLGSAVNGINPPNIISSEATYLRLEYYDEYLYFDYRDTSANRRTLLLNFDLGAFTRGEAPGGWFLDSFGVDIAMHYGEEGDGVHNLLIGGADATTSRLYSYGGDDDNGTAISASVTTPSLDQGDPRANKLYGDLMLDSDTGGLNVTVTPGVNNRATTFAAVTVNNASRLQDAIVLGTAWQYARNVSLNIAWSSSGAARPSLFIWGPRWISSMSSISAFAWESNDTIFTLPNYKYVGLIRITHTSTADLSLVTILDGNTQPTITITNSGGVQRTDVLRVPVWKAKLWKFRLSSTTEFRLDPTGTLFEMKQWGDTGPYQQLQPFS